MTQTCSGDWIRVYEDPRTSEVSAEYRSLEAALEHPARAGAEMIQNGEILYVAHRGGWVRPHLAAGGTTGTGYREVRMRLSEEASLAAEELAERLKLPNKADAVALSIRTTAIVVSAIKSGKVVMVQNADGSDKRALVIEGINGKPS